MHRLIDLLQNFSETNMGAGLRVSSGLDWAFSKIERAEAAPLRYPVFANRAQMATELR
jgi:hypothetical protein